jgi:uncharacterized protein YeaO (DUF488 family)
MSIRLVRLGEPRTPGEGLRIGTVRRPPRGVRRADFASKDWYDVWFPNLAPSAPLVDAARHAQTPAEWAVFVRRYRAEMGAPGPRHDLALLAALSRDTNFAVGCYCERAERCHRSVLRELLAEHGAQID